MAPKKGGKQSKAPSRAASGASTPAVRAEPVKQAPAVVGINLGQSFSSIAVINKEGLADCIANDDGERQIATALSFNGSEEYFGVPARVQLVRNAQNTILGFRNLLGKTYDEVKSIQQPYNSAPIVDANGQPGFTVSINDTPTTLTAHECTVRFLVVLLSYASDFLGRPITSAVLSVPADFTPSQTKALVAAATEAKITVVQTITEATSALTAYHMSVLTEEEGLKADRNAVVLDVGATSTTASVVAIREGLFVPLASVSDNTIGGDAFDAKLIDWFSKEFTKKTRVPLEASNHRAQLKLRLAVEVTKKSLSASTTAPCSVESLAEGMDFHGSINRMRFDLLAAAVYSKIVGVVEKALAEAKLDALEVQQVILVGGTTRLPTLADKLLSLFSEDTTTITSQLDTDEVIARGASLQGLSVLSPASLTQLNSSLAESTITSPSTLSAPIGLVIDNTFHTIVDSHTPLPLRRIVDLDIPASATQVLVSLAEGQHSIKVEQPPKKEVKKSGGFFSRSKPEDDEDDEDDEEDEIRTSIVESKKALADLVVDVDGSKKGPKGKSTKVRVSVVVVVGGKGTVSAIQLVDGAKEVSKEF